MVASFIRRISFENGDIGKSILGEMRLCSRSMKWFSDRVLVQQIQEQTIKSAQNFYGESLGRINSQLQGNRSQLESQGEQIPDEEAQIQEMADSYAVIEESFD